MALPPEDEKRLNAGAAHARVELEENWQRWTVPELAAWWSKWCHRDVILKSGILPGTNHDRLGRMLIDVAIPHPEPVYLDDDDDHFAN
jgi:hypothetical protein